MSGDDGNKTVFKPSPLVGLKNGGGAGSPPPPLKAVPSRPVKPSAPSAPAASSPAPAANAPPRQRSAPPPAREKFGEPQQADPGAGLPGGERRSATKDRRGGSSVPIWFWLLIGAAVLAAILYLVFTQAGLV